MAEDDETPKTNEGQAPTDTTDEKIPEPAAEEEPVKEDENAKEEPEEESWQYRLPHWFLQHNVTIASELGLSDPSIDWDGLDGEPYNVEDSIKAKSDEQLPAEAPSSEQPTPHERHHDWRFPSSDYLELRYAAASALALGPIGYLIPDESVILIRSAVPGSEPVLQAAITRISQENNANLISFDIEDLQDLASDLDLQVEDRKKKNLPRPVHDSCYTIPSLADMDLAQLTFAYQFGALSSNSSIYAPVWTGNAKGPVPKPTNTVLNAAKEKLKFISVKFEEPSGDEDAQSSAGPVFVHIRATHHFLTINTGIECIQNLASLIEDRRRAGEKIVLFISMVIKPDSHADDEENCPECLFKKALRKKLGARKESIISIELNRTSEADDDKRSRIERHARCIRRNLRMSLPQEIISKCDGLLAPYPQHNFVHDPEIIKLLEGASLTLENAHRTTRQLNGKASQIGSLTIEDFRTALETVHREKFKKEEPTTSELFQKKLKKLEEDCDKYEKIMLSCVVDTAQLETKYTDVVMENETKETVKQLISLSQLSSSQSHPLLQQVQMKGALFYGPPGTGKTHLTRAIARESGASMLAVDAGQLNNKWVGETEKNILALFSLCKKLYPCILFIDEADSLFYRRNSRDQSWRRNELTLFLQQMDGLLADRKTPFVIVATNRPNDLDEAFMRRLPYKAMFTLPTESERKQILRLFLKDADLEDPIIIEQLARKTEGYSGADLKSLCGQAALSWSVENSGKVGDDQKLLLTAQHFTKALRRSRPAATREIKKINEEFQQETAGGGPRTRTRQ